MKEFLTRFLNLFTPTKDDQHCCADALGEEDVPVVALAELVERQHDPFPDEEEPGEVLIQGF